MRKQYVDLHIHTNHSDGSDSPRRVVERAAELGLSAIAITDHDTVGGLEEGARAAEQVALEFLPGVELSAHFRDTELHVLGYGIRADCSPLCDVLLELEEGRAVRADRIVRRLNELAIPVERAKVAARAEGGIVGRMHIAQEIRALGFSETVQGAFDKYIGKGRPAFVRKQAITCDQAIDLIHEACGLAVLAHPGFAATRNVLSALLRLPFDGIEVYHSQHSPGQVTQFQQLAKEHDLLVTGGSDCHGHAKTDPDMGTVQVPYERYVRLKEALQNPKPGD